MKRSQLRSLVKEVLDEISTTGTGATFTPGTGAQYATPHAFGKGKRAKKTLTKIGWKQQQRPKRPSHTKMFDYL